MRRLDYSLYYIWDKGLWSEFYPLIDNEYISFFLYVMDHTDDLTYTDNINQDMRRWFL